MPGLILAVDQGSSSTRCVAFDARLAPIAQTSRPVTTEFPASGRVEHDARQILDGVLGAMNEALTCAGANWAEVSGVGLAGQTETFVVWERDTGRPVYPAISWRDTRTSDACAAMRAEGHETAIRSRTGLPLESAFSASKLRWLLAELPGARKAAAEGQLLFGDINCWLIWHLSGGTAHVTDPSMAARTMLFDIAAGHWDHSLLDLFGIPEAMLPAVRPTASPLAVTDAAVCGGRAAITACVGDQQAALFGQRCWHEGMAKLTLGTGAFLWCNAGDDPTHPVPAGVVSSCAWQLGGHVTYALEGFVPNAGAITTWLRQIGVLGQSSWPRIRPGALARAADGAWCVPALFGLGTPTWMPLTFAEIGNLTADSSGDDIAEAALIGVAHQIVDAIEAVRGGLIRPLELIRVDGGLAGNESVVAAIADLADLRLERTAATEVTALGVGALAGIGADQWDRQALAGLPFETDYAARPELDPGSRQAARRAWRRQVDAAIDRHGMGQQSAGAGSARTAS